MRDLGSTRPKATQRRDRLPAAGAPGLFPAIRGGRSGGAGSDPHGCDGGASGAAPQGDPSPRPLPSIGRPRGGNAHTPLREDPGPVLDDQQTSPMTSTSSSRSSFHQTQPPSPNKLPKISKSSSISNLAGLAGSVRRTTSLPIEGLRSGLCRSPSCPILWSGELNDGANSHLGSFSQRRSPDSSTKSDSPTKLPIIFGGSTISTRRSVSLQGRLSSLADAPLIGGVARTRRGPKRESSTMTTTSMPWTNGSDAKERLGVLAGQRSQNPMLLPIRDEPKLFKLSASKKNSVAPAGMRQASEGTSGDSGVSVGCRPSDRSDSSAAQDGSEIMGAWGAEMETEVEVEVEMEMDDETVHQGRLQEVTSAPSKDSDLRDAGDQNPNHHRTALSAEKCREWLKGVTKDGKSKQKPSRDKKAFKMPKIN